MDNYSRGIIQHNNIHIFFLWGLFYYIIRFSDMGIVINISILQWIVEVAVYIFCLFYMFFVAGLNSDLDRFFMLFLAGFTSIVLPAFYLNGDIEFRTDMAQNGYFNALKNALFVD